MQPPLDICFVYLGNKEITAVFKLGCMMSVLFSTKCYLFHNFLLLSSNIVFIKHMLKFKYPPWSKRIDWFYLELSSPSDAVPCSWTSKGRCFRQLSVSLVLCFLHTSHFVMCISVIQSTYKWKCSCKWRCYVLSMQIGKITVQLQENAQRTKKLISQPTGQARCPRVIWQNIWLIFCVSVFLLHCLR